MKICRDIHAPRRKALTGDPLVSPLASTRFTFVVVSGMSQQLLDRLP